MACLVVYLDRIREVREVNANLREQHLEALAVNDGRAALIVLLLGDPHLLEG